MRLHRSFPLAIHGGHEVHEGNTRSNLFNLLLIAAVALSHDVPIEFESAKEPHLRIVHHFLLTENEKLGQNTRIYA